MNRTRLAFLTALLGVSLIWTGWIYVRDKDQAQPVETSQTGACSSCDARHQNLKKLRDAKSIAGTADE